MAAAGDILLWLDTVPARNATLGFVWFFATLALALRPLLRRDPAPRGPLDSGWLFAAALLVTLCAFRWPIWFVPYELNPDESQCISGARTLLDYPIYWKHVDGTTHGPLVELFLVALAQFGLPLNYVTARFAATLLQWIALLGAWGALRRLAPEGVARVALFPGFTFLSVVQWGDYVHYATELVAVAQIGVALWLFAEGLLARPLARRGAIGCNALGAVVLGAVPYAKLQLAPLAALIGLSAVAVLLWRRAEPGASRCAVAAVVGALVPSVALVVYLGIFGLFGQFHGAYLLSNLGYMDSSPVGLVDMMSDFFALCSHGQSHPWFIWPALGYSLWQGRRAWHGADRPRRVVLALAWSAVVVGVYSVIEPGRMAAHYLNLLVLPVSLLAGLHFVGVAAESRATRRGVTVAAVGFLAVVAAPQIFRTVAMPHIYAGQLAEYRAAPPLPASAYLRAHARPDDLLAMWGWQSQVWIETGLAQGTREAHTAYQLTPGPLQQFYRDRYLRDMTRRQPAWFVDVVGPAAFGYINPLADGHETFPALAALIRERYTLVAAVGDVRIYRRNEGTR